MPLDVLEFNQLAIQYNNLQPAVNAAAVVANTIIYPASFARGSQDGSSSNGAFANSLFFSPEKANNFAYIQGCSLFVCPADCRTWANIPTLANTAGNSLRVFDSGVNGNAGVCCQWTVPAGATFARFEIWGAGAASKGNLCCGLSMFGGSGAYASVILPVVPGCQYTLCAGCAEFCCYYCTQGSITSGQGCASFVNGYGLSNFCAEGGDPSPSNWLQRASCGASAGVIGYCVIMNNQNGFATISKGTYYGMCMCGWGGFCANPGYQSPSESQQDMICWWPTSCRIYYGNLTIPATRNCHFVIGAPGMFNAMQMASTGTQHRYFISPPIVNMFCGTCGSCWLATTQGGGSCNGLYNQGAYPFPSRGGVGLNTCAGNLNYGGYGTAGAVCVYWV